MLSNGVKIIGTRFENGEKLRPYDTQSFSDAGCLWVLCFMRHFVGGECFWVAHSPSNMQQNLAGLW